MSRRLASVHGPKGTQSSNRRSPRSLNHRICLPPHTSDELHHCAYHCPCAIRFGFCKPCICSILSLCRPGRRLTSVVTIHSLVCANERFQFHCVFFEAGLCSEFRMEITWYKEGLPHDSSNASHHQLRIPLYVDTFVQSCLLFPFPSKASRWLSFYKPSWLTLLCQFSSVKPLQFPIT